MATVSIKVSARGASETKAAMESVTTSIKSLEKATAEASKSLKDFNTGAQAAGEATKQSSGGFLSMLKAIKDLVFTIGLAKIAYVGFTQGAMQGTNALQRFLTVEMRAIQKLLASLGATRASDLFGNLARGVETVMQPMHTAVRFLSDVWHAAFRSMHRSSSLAIRTAALTFESSLNTMRAVALEFGTAIARLRDRMRGIGEGVAGLSIWRKAFDTAALAMAHFLVTVKKVGPALRGFGASVSGFIDGGGFRRLGESVGNAGRRLKGFGGSLVEAGAGVLAMVKRVRLLVAVLTTLGVLLVSGIVAAGLIKLAAAGAKLVPIERAFNKLSASIKTTSAALTEDLQRATLDTVSRIDLMKSSVLALNSGAIKTRAELRQVARAAQVLAQTVGISTAEAFDNLVRGIGLVNPNLIKSVGVLVSADEAYRNYANSINKSVGALTDHERKEAFRIEVLSKLDAAVRRVDSDQVSLTNSLQEMTAAARNWSNASGRQIAQSEQLIGFVDGLAAAFTGLTKVLQRNEGVLTRFTDFIFGSLDFVSTAIPVFGPLFDFAQEMGGASRDAERFARASKEIGIAAEFMRNQRGLNLVPTEDLTRIAQLTNRVRRLRNEFLNIAAAGGDTSAIEGMLNAAQLQLGQTVDRAKALLEQSLEIQNVWRDIPQDLSNEQIADAFVAAKEALASATLEAVKLGIAWDNTEDAAARGELLTQIQAVREKIASANNEVDYFGQALEEALQSARAGAAAFDQSFNAQASVAGAAQAASDALAAQVPLAESVVDAILREAAATKNVREERERLNQALESGLSSAGRAADAIQGFQSAGISPLDAAFSMGDTGQLESALQNMADALRESIRLQEDAGGGVDGALVSRLSDVTGALDRLASTPSLRESLLDLADLREAQREWSLVLQGNSEAIEELATAAGFSEEEVKRLKDALSDTSAQSLRLAQSLVTTLGGGIEALVAGTQEAAAIMIRTTSRLLEQQVAAAGNPFLGTLIGTVGGIAGALFGRNNRRQRVEIDRFSQEALTQQERLSQRGPSVVTLQFIDPRTGQVTSETVQQLNRLEQRDAVTRVNIGVSP